VQKTTKNMDYNTAFKILGIRPPLDSKEVKQAYIRLAKIHHPDMGGSKESFVMLKTAYDLLSENLNYINAQNNQSQRSTSRSAAYYENKWEETAKKQAEYYRKEAELKAKRRAEYYQNNEVRYRPSERKTPKTKKGFVKAWRELNRLMLSELKKSTPGKDIGGMLERKLEVFRKDVCPIKDEWFLGALDGLLYRKKDDKQMKRYFDMMMYIAPEANTRHQWAQKYFELEFGHKFPG
jgi:hypothetical protein